MTKVLITGGNGMIGKQLTKILMSLGYEVVHLSRDRNSDGVVQVYEWNIEQMLIDPKALIGVDSVIHLAGAGIADKPWTDERKKEIIDSRVRGAELILRECKNQGIKLKSFISASAIGWYPLIISNETYTEESQPGEGFLSEVCKLWEASADQFQEVAESVAKIRIGIVLCKDGGALPTMALPVKYFLGAVIGNGKQAMPWIHLRDVCHIFAHVLEHKLSGVYNAVGPENATNQEFMQTLADVLDKPMLLPNVPEFAIKMVFGPKADLITKGVKISSDKIKSTDFHYEYPTLNTALSEIFSL